MVIFDGSLLFYRKYGTGNGRQEESSSKFAGQAAVGSKPLSSFLIGNINFWGLCGGFEAIKTRLLQAASNPSNRFVPTVKMIRSIEAMAPILQPKFLCSYVASLNLVDLMVVLITSISDKELKTLDKDALRIGVRSVNNLLDMTGERDQAENFSETSRLDICFRLLTSSILSRKVQGVTELQVGVFGVCAFWLALLIFFVMCRKYSSGWYPMRVASACEGHTCSSPFSTQKC